MNRTGEERWSFVSGAPVVDANGNVELAVSVFREFTDRLRSEQSWQFLAAASEALGSSLDYEVTLTQLADLAVPQIADWCSVDVLGPDDSLEQLAVAHVDAVEARAGEGMAAPLAATIRFGRVTGSSDPGSPR